MTTMSLRFAWRDALGVRREWTPQNGITVEKGVRGLDGAPQANTLAPYTATDGALLTSSRRTRRPLDIPLYLRDDTDVTESVLVPMLQAFATGLGQLEVTTSFDGVDVRTRELQRVIYQAGLEGDLSPNRGHHQGWRKVVLGLEALDPWWRDDMITSVLVPEAATDPVPSDDPTVVSDDPATPSNGQTGSQINNIGHVEVFPEIILAGPMDAGAKVELFRRGPGGPLTPIGSWTTTTSIGVAYMIVNHDPQSEWYGPVLSFLVEPDDTQDSVDWSLLEEGAYLFPIPATNLDIYDYFVTWTATGTSGGSSCQVRWRNRWFTP